MGKSTTIAVDLAKSLFEVALGDLPGRGGEQQLLRVTSGADPLVSTGRAGIVDDLRRPNEEGDSAESDAGSEPITIPAFGAGASDWLPARGLPPGSEPVGLQREAVDTTAVLPFVRSRAARYLREESRYEVFDARSPESPNHDQRA